MRTNNLIKNSTWTKQKVENLLKQVSGAKSKSAAFGAVARKMGLQPQSVRNFYYSDAWRKHVPDGDKTVKKSEKFTKLEVVRFLRSIILGYSRGESFRSICFAHAKGDKSKMLRYQNKYRATFEKSPEVIAELCATLESEGYLVKNPIISKAKTASAKAQKTGSRVSKMGGGGLKTGRSSAKKGQLDSDFETLENRDNIITFEPASSQHLSDQDIQNLFMGLIRLVRKQNQSQIEKLRSEVERLTRLAKTTQTES